MKKYRAPVILGLVLAAVVLAVVVGSGRCGADRSEEAASYVRANLTLLFQGDPQEARRFLDASDAELRQIYENDIRAFVDSYLMGGIDTGNLFSDTYGELIKQIFSTMRYRVESARREEDGTYRVTVYYCPVDVFTRFIPELKKESQRISREAEAGKYDDGGEDAQSDAETGMFMEYMGSALSLLESSYIDMQYGEEQRFDFTVSRGEDGGPLMDPEELNTFLERIFELDNP